MPMGRTTRRSLLIPLACLSLACGSAATPVIQELPEPVVNQPAPDVSLEAYYKPSEAIVTYSYK